MGGAQERIDRRPHVKRPKMDGTEAGAAANTSKDRFPLKPTHLQGVSLRTEPGSNPEVPESVVEAFLADAVAFKEADAREKAAAKERDSRRDRILPLIKDYPGLRGIISEPDDAIVTAIPSEKKVEWDIDLIRGSLPTAGDYHEVVTETVVVEFPKPAGVKPEVIKSVMAEAIYDLGKGILRTRKATFTVLFDVNERRLASRLKALGRSLLPGARTSTTEFSLTAGPLIKNPPKDETAK